MNKSRSIANTAMRNLRGILAFLLGITILALLVWALRQDISPVASGMLITSDGNAGTNEIAGYSRATGAEQISFPEDFGPHPDYQTEWWYYTGNLSSTDGRHFGFQLTFFRRALRPPNASQPRLSNWAADQVYMAHFALTDVHGKVHSNYERLSRASAGLAGAQSVPYKVWLEDWSVEQTGEATYHLKASQDDLAIDLQLTDIKGPILHGDEGYSQKGPDPGNASYYYSQTRLATQGTVSIDSTTTPVNGYSWKDHEYSTSALSDGQIGWDWFSIQLDNQIEIMMFQMRRDDGSIDPFSSGTWVAPDGSTQHLTIDDFSITTLDTWKSPNSGAIYPARWLIQIPAQGLTLEVVPHLADQEMDLSYNYWEGAVKVTGNENGRPVTGNGYIEMTGYSKAMTGEF